MGRRANLPWLSICNMLSGKRGDGIITGESSPQDTEADASQVEGSNAGLSEVQGRLRSFLKQSSRYDPRLVLARIRGSSLWQEQVILHSKVIHPHCSHQMCHGSAKYTSCMQALGGEDLCLTC